jgi:GNAT superfamily N-acetyltransferase
MYTLPSARGKGIGSSLLQGLENWAAELGYRFCILETGKKQEDAVWLYVKNGYTRIDNFGQYEGVDNSVCYKKPV